MNPQLRIRRHGRKIATVGALVAVSATTAMALVAGNAAATPSATKPARCIDTVNVRAEPSTTSKIVAVCKSGQSVQAAETRSGFVHLTDLKGWAAAQFVSVNGAKPATPAPHPTTTSATGRPTTAMPTAPTTAAGGSSDTGKNRSTNSAPVSNAKRH